MRRSTFLIIFLRFMIRPHFDNLIYSSSLFTNLNSHGFKFCAPSLIISLGRYCYRSKTTRPSVINVRLLSDAYDKQNVELYQSNLSIRWSWNSTWPWIWIWFKLRIDFRSKIWIIDRFFDWWLWNREKNACRASGESLISVLRVRLVWQREWLSKFKSLYF